MCFAKILICLYLCCNAQAEDIISFAGNEKSSQQLHSAGFNSHADPPKPITVSSTSTNNQTEPLPLNPSKNSTLQQRQHVDILVHLAFHKSSGIWRRYHTCSSTTTSFRAKFPRALGNCHFWKACRSTRTISLANYRRNSAACPNSTCWKCRKIGSMVRCLKTSAEEETCSTFLFSKTISQESYLSHTGLAKA